MQYVSFEAHFICFFVGLACAYRDMKTCKEQVEKGS